MQRSPVGVSLYTMPIEEAMDIFGSMDMANRPALLDFLNRFTEDQLATNGWASMWYAELVLHGRFQKGESAIRGNWGGIGGKAEDMWDRYKNFVLSRPPYAANSKLTSEGKDLYYEYGRMDNQMITQRG